jgi:hypothetical protein
MSLNKGYSAREVKILTVSKSMERKRRKPRSGTKKPRPNVPPLNL